MCTYTFTLDDQLVDRISPQFSSRESLRLWLQRELELMIIHHAESYSDTKLSDTKEETKARMLEIASGKKKLHFSDLKGILAGSSRSAEELRDNYIREKYGI